MSDNFRDLPLPPAAAAAGITTATSLVFTEGPAWDANGTLYFSDIANNRILQLNVEGERSVYREPSGRTNGNTFDREGRLLHCEGAEFGAGGGRRISRSNPQTGAYEILTEQYDGMKYNSPNDICVDGKDRIYFTDPMYDDRSQLEMKDADGNIVDGVYRIDDDHSVTRILQQPDIDRPNGIAVTQDSRTLYLVDSCPVDGGNRKIWAFDLDDAGTPSNQRVVVDFAPGRGGDGMRLDMEGNLYIAAGVMTTRGPHETLDVPTGVYIFSPAGEPLGRIPISEDVITNLAFGGQDGKTLYVTAGKTVFSTRVAVPGQVSYPTWSA